MPPSQTTPADTTPQLDDSMLGIVLNNATEYSVIRAEYAANIVKQAASSLLRAISENTGVTPAITSDWAKDTSTIDHHAPEIIVGDSNRAACEGLIDSIADRTFIIRVVDNQVLIAGATDKLTARAVDYFISEYINNPEYCSDGQLVLPRELNDVQGPFEFEMTDLINSEDSYITKEEKLFSIANVDGHRIMQGGCTDGTYCYFAMVTNTDTQHAYIYKYSVKDWKPVARSESLPTDHTNDICYNPDTNELIIAHNAPNRYTLTVLDADTMAVKKTFNIGHRIFSIAYNQSRSQYVVGLSGGQDFAILDSNFETVKQYNVNSTGYTTQGVECDDDFIYFVQYNQNVIMVYDWDGKLVTRIDLELSGVEPENISLVDGEFIIGCNNSTWTGGVIYRVEVIKKN